MKARAAGRRCAGAWAGVWALALALLAATAGAARADLTLGVFAPAAPLKNTEARVTLGADLGEFLSEQLPDRPRVRSRVFVRAADFEREAKDLSMALVDVSYVPRLQGGWVVVATTKDLAWHLVAARGIDSKKALSQLSDRRLLVAAGGSQDLAERVANGLLRGEASWYFTEIASAPDSASALASLALGKAACVLLPLNDSLPLPPGVLDIFEVEAAQLPGMVLVVSARMPEEQRRQLGAVSSTFRWGEPVGGLYLPDDRVLDSVLRRLAVQPRRGPMAAAPLRALVDQMLVKPEDSIPMAPPQLFVARPPSAGSAAPAPAAPGPSPTAPAQGKQAR